MASLYRQGWARSARPSHVVLLLAALLLTHGSAAERALQQAPGLVSNLVTPTTTTTTRAPTTAPATAPARGPTAAGPSVATPTSAINPYTTVPSDANALSAVRVVSATSSQVLAVIPGSSCNGQLAYSGVQSDAQVFAVFTIYDSLQKIDFLIRAVGPFSSPITGINLASGAANSVGNLLASLIPGGVTPPAPTGSTPTLIASGTLPTTSTAVDYTTLSNALKSGNAYLMIATQRNPVDINSPGLGGGEVRGQVVPPAQGFTLSTASLQGPNAQGTLPTTTAPTVTCPSTAFSRITPIPSSCSTQAAIQASLVSTCGLDIPTVALYTAIDPSFVLPGATVCLPASCTLTCGTARRYTVTARTTSGSPFATGVFDLFATSLKYEVTLYGVPSADSFGARYVDTTTLLVNGNIVSLLGGLIQNVTQPANAPLNSVTHIIASGTITETNNTIGTAPFSQIAPAFPAGTASIAVSTSVERLVGNITSSGAPAPAPAAPSNGGTCPPQTVPSTPTTPGTSGTGTATTGSTTTTTTTTTTGTTVDSTTVSFTGSGAGIATGSATTITTTNGGPAVPGVTLPSGVVAPIALVGTNAAASVITSTGFTLTGCFFSGPTFTTTITTVVTIVQTITTGIISITNGIITLSTVTINIVINLIVTINTTVVINNNSNVAPATLCPFAGFPKVYSVPTTCAIRDFDGFLKSQCGLPNGVFDAAAKTNADLIELIPGRSFCIPSSCSFTCTSTTVVISTTTTTTTTTTNTGTNASPPGGSRALPPSPAGAPMNPASPTVNITAVGTPIFNFLGLADGASVVRTTATTGRRLLQNNGPAFATGVFTLLPNNNLNFVVKVQGPFTPIIGAQLYIGAKGVTGPAIANLDPKLGVNGVQVLAADNNEFTLTSGTLTPSSLLGGNTWQNFQTLLLQSQIYMQIATTGNPNGDVRGQVIPQGIPTQLAPAGAPGLAPLLAAANPPNRAAAPTPIRATAPVPAAGPGTGTGAGTGTGGGRAPTTAPAAGPTAGRVAPAPAPASTAIKPFTITRTPDLTFVSNAAGNPPTSGRRLLQNSNLPLVTCSVQVFLAERAINFRVDVGGTWALSPGGGLPTITQAHIHQGPAGVNGPIVWNFFVSSAVDPNSNLQPYVFPTATNNPSRELASGTLTASQITAVQTFDQFVSDLSAGNEYCNVHTLTFPAGEARAQFARANGTAPATAPARAPTTAVIAPTVRAPTPAPAVATTTPIVARAPTPAVVVAPLSPVVTASPPAARASPPVTAPASPSPTAVTTQPVVAPGRVAPAPAPGARVASSSTG